MVLSFSLALQKAAAEVTKLLAPSILVSSKPVSLGLLSLAIVFVVDSSPRFSSSLTLFDAPTSPPTPLPETLPTPSSLPRPTLPLRPRTSGKETSTKQFDPFTEVNDEKGNETRPGNHRRDLSARSSSMDRVGAAFEELSVPGGGTRLGRGKGWEDCSTEGSNDPTNDQWTFAFFDSFARLYRPCSSLIVCILRNEILYL